MKWLISAVILAWPITIWAQSVSAGLQSGISYSWSEFNGEWTVSATPFYIMVQNSSSKSWEWNPEFQKIELDLRYSRRLGIQWNGTIGYQWKGNGPLQSITSDHTFFQYVSIDNNRRIGRLGHRFRLDERLKSAGFWIVRPRYRLSLKRPLGGTESDTGKCYFVARQELIGKITSSRFSTENRLGLAVGRVTHGQDKVELGLEHRMDDFINRATHMIYLTLDFYLK